VTSKSAMSWGVVPVWARSATISAHHRDEQEPVAGDAAGQHHLRSAGERAEHERVVGCRGVHAGRGLHQVSGEVGKSWRARRTISLTSLGWIVRSMVCGVVVTPCTPRTPSTRLNDAGYPVSPSFCRTSLGWRQLIDLRAP
jgi:hypothetical protein